MGGTSRAEPGLSPPCPPPFLQQRFQDTSQYVCAELQALEQEQRQIDGRAAEVETQLRSLMESGGADIWSPLPNTCHRICPALQPFLIWGGVGRRQGWGHCPHLQRDKGSSLPEAPGSGFWDAVRKRAPIPSHPTPASWVDGRPGDCPGRVQVPTGCRRRC